MILDDCSLDYYLPENKKLLEHLSLRERNTVGGLDTWASYQIFLVWSLFLRLFCDFGRYYCDFLTEQGMI